MDFGIVASDKANSINFDLPADGNETLKTFENRRPLEFPEIRIALSRWGRSEWCGKFFPSNITDARFLKEYSKHFNTVECNAVFYSIPSSDLIKKWHKMVGQVHKKDFLFLPKMSRLITHIKRLANVEEPTAIFLENIKSFGEYLGPILIQLGDNFGAKKMFELADFVQRLPKNQRFFVELRHEEWFGNPIHRQLVFKLFRDNNIGSVITDTGGRRDVLHMELPIPETYIRFNGLGGDFKEIDRMRIDTWVDRIDTWLRLGLEKIYFIISQQDERDTPALAQYAIEQFNHKFGTTIRPIPWNNDASGVNDSGEIFYKINLGDLKDGKTSPYS